MFSATSDPILQAALWAGLIALALTAVMALAIVLLRLALLRDQQRWDRFVQTWRPLLLALMMDDEVAASDGLPPLLPRPDEGRPIMGFEPMPMELIPPVLTAGPELSTERFGMAAMPLVFIVEALVLFTVTMPAVLMLLKPLPAISNEAPRPPMPPPLLPLPPTPPHLTCTCTSEGALPPAPGTVRCTLTPPTITTSLVAPLRTAVVALAPARLFELPEVFSLY